MFRARLAHGSRVLPLEALAALAALAACVGSPATSASSDALRPSEPGPADHGGAVETAEARPDAPRSPAPDGSCEQLEAQFSAADRALRRECSAREDCSLLWSEYNCYALRGPKDDVSKLEAVDEAMKAKGCFEVECEPPPMIKCSDGVCVWDL